MAAAAILDFTAFRYSDFGRFLVCYSPHEIVPETVEKPFLAIFKGTVAFCRIFSGLKALWTSPSELQHSMLTWACDKLISIEWTHLWCQPQWPWCPAINKAVCTTDTYQIYVKLNRCGNWKSSWIVAHWCGLRKASRIVISICATDQRTRVTHTTQLATRDVCHIWHFAT